MSKSLLDALKRAVTEKDVENAYRAEISRILPEGAWTSPHNTDGCLSWSANKPVRLLFEAKYDLDLRNRMAACTVLGQAVIYLKRFEGDPVGLPHAVLIADKNECFLVPTASLQSFLALEIDWKVAASKGNAELTRALMTGYNVLPFVHDVKSGFSLKDVIVQAEGFAKGAVKTVRADEKNLCAIFEHWVDRVFKSGGKSKQTLSSAEKADIFLRCLFSPQEVYLHPAKKGVLVVPGHADGVLVDHEQYNSFFQHFSQGYKPSEIKKLMSIKDRLLEDDNRRRQGAFFTPAIWSEEAHKEVAKVLGDDWRKDCIVWDCCAGTANMTRDHHDWGCLISSTLEKTDVEAMQRHRWGGDHVFQYDFLNGDPVPPSVDAELKKAAAEGKRLVWFMNPPYGTAGDAGTKGTSKAGIANTAVNEKMKTAKLGAPSQQLYAQFMFRCRAVAEQYGFKDYSLGLFSVPTFMTSGSYKPFRDWWYGAYSRHGGFLFQASHFAGVSGRWGVAFTVWNAGGETKPQETQTVRLCDERNFAVVTDGTKQIYNADGREASEWVRASIKGSTVIDTPQMSSGLVTKNEGRGKSVTGGVFYMMSNSNNLMGSGQLTFMTSLPGTRDAPVPVLPSNWRRAVALYGARKLVQENWVNQKDEYLTPDESKPGYEQWVNDCHVYALLHNANNCTAMRDVQYKGKAWQIQNNWFWLTKKEALDLLDTSETMLTHRDCEVEKAADPYFAQLLTGGLALSADAEKVLDLTKSLWVKSLPFRESYYSSRAVTEDEPDLHLTAWDAGIYQLKHLWRDLFPTEWAGLKAAHKALAELLEEGVYTYGFLRK
jgi:hypothetical protein